MQRPATIVITLFSVFTLLFMSCKHEPDTLPGNNPSNPNEPGTGEVNQCDPDSVYFANTILPILSTSCAYSGCHSSDNPQEGIDLTSYQSIMASGVIEKGNASQSELYEVLVEDDPEDRMPFNLPPLSEDKIAAIRNWINQGAKNNYCDAACDTTNFTYSGAIMKIMADNCTGCHGPNVANAGIRLDSHGAVASVASSGLLMGVITHTSGTPMPYSANPANQRKLSECTITQVRKWVEAGAPNN